jgi:AraC family transcriptional regulator
MLEYIQDMAPCYRRLLSPPHPGIRIRSSIPFVGAGRPTGGEYDWDGMTRDTKGPWTLLQYTLKGKGHLIHEGKEYTVPEQHAMLLTVPGEHRYYLPKGGEWDHFYFGFLGAEMTYFWNKLISRNGPVLHLPANKPIGKHLASMWVKLIKGKVETQYAASAVAHDIAMSLMEYTEHTVYAENRPSAPVVQAQEFIGKHLADPSLGVAALAKAADLSRHHFSRRFKIETGLPPGEYLTSERLKLAEQLLYKTDDTIQLISENCGYSDPNYFARAFRKHFKLSPRAYRKYRLKPKHDSDTPDLIEETGPQNGHTTSEDGVPFPSPYPSD